MATRVVPDGIGASPRRKEDGRFITGRGQYTDDIVLPGQLYAAFVRSPHAHARVRSVNATRARGLAGVRSVYTGADLKAAGVNPIPVAWLLPGLNIGEYMPLATDTVRYVGNPVAIVIADSPARARDAADAIDVDYDVLDGIADATAALAAGAPVVHSNAPGNVAFNWAIGDADATAAAFATATTVVTQRVINQRLIANAIEPRACNATFSRGTDELTLYVTSQNPHVHRLLIGAFILGIPEHKFRVISTDVGGGFGSKIFIYPEEVVCCWVAKQLGAPVKWTATRSESFMTDVHGRDHATDVGMAFDANGKILGLRVNTVANLGAYLSAFAPAVPTWLYGTLLSGQYTIANIHCTVTGAYSNTTPVDAYRGAGRPEACYVLERVMDVAARKLALDPAELRRRNFIRPEQFPYQTPVALQYDSGNYVPALDRALEIVGYAALRKQQAEARAKGRYIGIGLSCYVEACGAAPSAIAGAIGAQAGLYETGTVRVHPTGKVTVFTGSHQQGQGHETTFAQIAANELGVAIDDVDVVHGDTGRIAFGMGTYASRSGAVGGTAIFLSLQKIREKGKVLAAHMLEAAVDDMEFESGQFFVKGSPERSKSWGEVCLAAYLAHSMPAGVEPGLEATTFYDPSNFVYPFGTHIAVVEVDADTGAVELKRFVAVDDVGNVINPMIVEGQIHGGIAQGVGQALWEAASYDSGGQLLSGSMMTYALPRASNFPMYELDRTVTPSPVNPLGVKGVGEAGTIGSTPAIANAVNDALSGFGITHLDMPLTPGKIWQAIHTAKAGS